MPLPPSIRPPRKNTHRTLPSQHKRRSLCLFFVAYSIAAHSAPLWHFSHLKKCKTRRKNVMHTRIVVAILCAVCLLWFAINGSDLVLFRIAAGRVARCREGRPENAHGQSGRDSGGAKRGQHRPDGPCFAGAPYHFGMPDNNNSNNNITGGHFYWCVAPRRIRKQRCTSAVCWRHSFFFFAKAHMRHKKRCRSQDKG